MSLEWSRKEGQISNAQSNTYHMVKHITHTTVLQLYGFCPGQPRWASTRSNIHPPTHIYHGHKSSLLCFIHLLRSMAPSLFNPRAWQSFFTISLQVFFRLPLGLAPYTSYSIHFFTKSSSAFSNTCPYHHNLFHCSTKIMSSNPSLSISTLPHGENLVKIGPVDPEITGLEDGPLINKKCMADPSM